MNTVGIRKALFVKILIAACIPMLWTATPGKSQTVSIPAIPIPPEAQRVADFLRRMGRTQTAQKFEEDIRTGRASFGNLKPGTNGETGPSITWANANATTYNNNMINQVRPTTPFNSAVLIGWAITVEHEYTHMDQYHPAQTPKFENPAWAQSLEMCQTWMRSVKSEMTRLGLEPDSPTKAAQLADLQKIMEGLRSAHNDTISGIKEGIAGGTIDPKGPWPNVDMTSSTDIDKVAADTRDTATRYAKGAESDAQSTKRRLEQQEKERLAKEREKQAQEQQAKVQQAKEQKERERQEKEKLAKAASQKPPPPPAPATQAPSSQAGTTTVTKGDIKGKDGSRIVSTETRDASGKVISTSTTEYDANGKKTGETTYEAGTGEGQDKDLKGSEAESGPVSITVDAQPILGSTLSGLDGKRAEKASSGFTGMEKAHKLSKAGKAGDGKLNEAKNTINKGGQDAGIIGDETAVEISKGDAGNSWGKTIGDAIQSGITAGGAAFGTAVGAGIADEATSEIFDHNRHKGGDTSTTKDDHKGTKGSSSTSSGSSSSGSSKSKGKSNSAGIPQPPVSTDTNSPAGSNTTTTASGTNTTPTATGTNSTTATAPAEPQGWKCPNCGSYDTTYVGTYYMDGSAMYDCHGCGGRVH